MTDPTPEYFVAADQLNHYGAPLEEPPSSGPVLTSERVREIFVNCVTDAHPDPLVVEGITHNVAFNRDAIETHRAEINTLLNELPDQFHAGRGGGWSFLNACDDRHGNQWTGLQQIMEELFLLGMAIGRVRYCLPRDMWDVMPGGVPYLIVDKP